MAAFYDDDDDDGGMDVDAMLELQREIQGPGFPDDDNDEFMPVSAPAVSASRQPVPRRLFDGDEQPAVAASSQMALDDVFDRVIKTATNANRRRLLQNDSDDDGEERDHEAETNDEDDNGDREDENAGDKLPAASAVPAKKSYDQIMAERAEVERAKVLERRPMFDEVVGLKHSGKMVFLRKRKVLSAAALALQEQRKRREQQLLSVPIDQLMEEYHDKIAKDNAPIVMAQDDDDDETQLEHPSPARLHRQSSHPSTAPKDLWVDKYRASKYPDLLSDERVNRQVMSWLKSWDECVFGRKPTQTQLQQQKRLKEKYKDKPVKFQKPEDPLHRPDRKIMLLTGPPGLGKTTLAHVLAAQAGYNVIEINASDDRSADVLRNKVLAAMEMNTVNGGNRKPNCIILDEIDGLDNKNGEKNPLDFLLKMILIDPKQPQNDKEGEGEASRPVKGSSSNGGGGGDDDDDDDEEDGQGVGSATAASTTPSSSRSASKKQKALRPIIRPVICICNDKYAPVLRVLRREAAIFDFPRIPVQKLTGRLKMICEREGLQLDSKTLVALSELTDGDMRATLNTLQFIKRSGNKTINIDTIKTVAVGLRDQEKNFFNVLDELFSKVPSKRSKERWDITKQHRHQLTDGEGVSAAAHALNEMGAHSQFGPAMSQPFIDRILSLVDSSSLEDRLIDGCFQNYPRVKYNDPGFSNTLACLDWLAVHDRLDSFISRSQDYSVYGYKSFCLAGVHSQCAAVSHPQLDFPTDLFKVSKLRTYAEDILSTFSAKLKPELHRQSKEVLVSEWLPFLTRVLSPTFRPANKHLMSSEEKMTMARLIDVMLDQGLLYQQYKTQEGVYRYALEPPVHDLVGFSRAAMGTIMNFGYQATQMLATELEREHIHRATQALAVVHNAIASQEATKMSQIEADARALQEAAAALSAKRKEAELEASRKRQKLQDSRPPTDFFGRPIANHDQPAQGPPQGQGEDQAPMQIAAAQGPVVEHGRRSRADEALMQQREIKAQPRVWYRFNEGFSNAVRKPVLLRDMLQVSNK